MKSHIRMIRWCRWSATFGRIVSSLAATVVDYNLPEGIVPTPEPHEQIPVRHLAAASWTCVAIDKHSLPGRGFAYARQDRKTQSFETKAQNHDTRDTVIMHDVHTQEKSMEPLVLCELNTAEDSAKILAGQTTYESILHVYS